MGSNLSKILNDALSYAVPGLCFGCNALLYRGEQLLCAFCRNELPLTDFNYSTENHADRLFYGRCHVEKAAAMLYYSECGVVPNLIHSLKYRGQEQIGRWLGEWYGHILAREPRLQNVSVVLPVPLHPRKRRKRGYNQAAGFGKAIAGRLGARYCGENLCKRINTPSQTTKNRWRRWKGAAGVFDLRRPWELEGKDILIVDDVLTTGATLESCVAVLERVRKKRIFIAVMAVVP